MDKPAIKKFAIWARNKLIADTKYRAGLVGVTETAVAEPLPQSNETVQFFDVGLPQPYRIEGDAVTQRQRFVAELNKETAKQGSYTAAYQTVVDKVAYTWFNRLIAVRYMEVNDLLPSRTRVLSSADGRAEPQIVTSPFDAVLDYTPAEQQQIVTLKNDNKLDEVFRLLFLKQCAALGDCLPRLFEQVDDYMPLLLALSFTDKDGVVCHLVNDIPESDWQDAVQIVGWLYQYYNTEPKEQVFANLKKNIKISKENIPAATQLFTPDWIVRYMVENSLGRLWSEGHPDFDKSEWKYYLDEAPQEPQVAQQLAELRKGYAALKPEDIKCIDPCMGSGHILAYLFDVLMQIYRSAGYTDRDAAASIVEHMVTVHLDMRKDVYLAEFSNLGVKDIPIEDEYPQKYDRLLCGGIWCIVQLSYEFIEEDKKSAPIRINRVTPIQMPHVDLDEIRQGRKAFSKEEWLGLMLRSAGYEPESLTYREQWLLLTRMIPLIENNFNLCELGPRSTGKSHIYKEISPNSILVSGGQTTVANLFYNMGRKTVGLVGLWDCVAFDEVAGIKFKDKDGVQIMKDYMASGSFARGKEEKAASASMVFVGNINQSVDVVLKTSTLFEPFPPEMGTDTAFLDRIHCYLPGWEIPKFRPEHFTNSYGFISDYMAEFIRELRKVQYGDALDKYFKLGKNLNQRDTIAVRRMVDGYLKLMYPNGEFSKDELEEVLRLSLEMRRRVKEQLKKLGGMEFYDVNFSYIDNETFEEKYVSVPEQGGDTLIPEGMGAPGQLYTISRGKSGMIGAFRLESQMLPGSGKFDKTGLGSDGKAKEAANTAFNFLKANARHISGNISTTAKDYIVNYQDLQGIGMTEKLALPTVIALCSIAIGRPTLSSLAVLGDISIGGTLIKVDELANTLQACADCGAKKVLLPAVSMVDFATVPADLMTAFQLIPYQNAEDAVFKALGVE